MSEEKITEKYFNVIEKTLQDTIAYENKKTLLRDYKDFLLDELRTQEKNEKTLQENLNRHSGIENSALETKCLKLQETVTECERYIDQLRDELENWTIQAIADKETLKIENAEKENQIISHYDAEVAKLKKQLENNIREQKKIEQDIKNQITLETATRNARLEEIRGNLQRQIVEKNSNLIKMQNEHKELRKELNMLKTQEQPNANQYMNAPSRSEAMEFHNFGIQQNQTNSFNSGNTLSNICPPRKRPSTTEYSTTEPKNRHYPGFEKSRIANATNTFGRQYTDSIPPNINNSFSNNQEYMNNDTTSGQVASEHRRMQSNSGSYYSTKDRINGNSNQHNQLSTQEVDYLAAEYEQFNETFAYSLANIDAVNAKLMEMVPKSQSAVNRPGSSSLTENIRNDPRQTTKKSKVDAPKSLNPIISSKHNDTLTIEDPDIFDKELIIKTESFNYDINPLDVPRKEPTVFIGEKRQKIPYKKSYGYNSKENYSGKGTTLNTISELNAKKKK